MFSYNSGFREANLLLVSSGHSFEIVSWNRGHAVKECMIGSDELLVVGTHF
jgi:hypothetical protein